MILAKNIRYLRKIHNWSQDYVADKLGYKSYTTIQKWEMGVSEPPIKKLKELAELFNVNMNDLTSKDLELQSGEKEKPSQRDEKVNNIIRLFAEMSEEQQEALLSYAKYLSQNLQ